MLRSVAQTVSAQPLNYLQNFGGLSDLFLYERARAGKVMLKPGAAYCLRRFQLLVQQLVRSHWMEHIKRNRRSAEAPAFSGRPMTLKTFYLPYPGSRC